MFTQQSAVLKRRGLITAHNLGTTHLPVSYLFCGSWSLCTQAYTNGAPQPVEAPKAKVRDPVSDDQLVKLQDLLQRSQAAQHRYSTFSQEQVDAIFKAAALAANQARIPLAKMAVEETGMGVVEDKVSLASLACSLAPVRSRSW